MKILSNFELQLWLNCNQTDGYQSGYFHKIWMEYYCMDKNQGSETFC